MSNNEILIFSYRVARDLILNNFQTIDVRLNKKMQDRTIYVFDNNDKTREYLKSKHNIIVN